jgi:hypothetical protein
MFMFSSCERACIENSSTGSKMPESECSPSTHTHPPPPKS